jgi:predicted membrane GTPase involved in stress response
VWSPITGKAEGGGRYALLQHLSIPLLTPVLRPAVAPFPACSIASGSVRVGDPLVAMDLEGKVTEEAKVTRLFARRGMAAIALEQASAGDIVQIAGLGTPVPTSTLAAPGTTRPLYADPLDPPTLSMCFGGEC